MSTSTPAPGSPLRLPALIALGCLTLAGIAVALPLGRLGGAIIGPRPPEPRTPADPQKDAQARAAEYSRYVAQINGRSIFHDPAAPSTPAPPPEEPSDRPAAAPTTYGGPPIIAMINDAVWFADGTRLSLADEAQGDLELLAIHAPWDATVRWKGVQFKVELFARHGVVIKDAPREHDSTPVVPAQDFEPAPPKPPAPKPADKPAEPSPAPTNPAPAQGG